MAQYTLAEAAKATGKSKSTILRSIKAGRISAVRDELGGGWLVEPAELHRLYAEHDSVRDAVNGEVRTGHRTGYDAAIRELQTERERERTLLLDQIADLRDRLTDSEKERRATAAQLTALLTDQRPVRSPDATAPDTAANAARLSEDASKPNGAGTEPAANAAPDSSSPARRPRWWPWR